MKNAIRWINYEPPSRNVNVKRDNREHCERIMVSEADQLSILKRIPIMEDIAETTIINSKHVTSVM